VEGAGPATLLSAGTADPISLRIITSDEIDGDGDGDPACTDCDDRDDQVETNDLDADGVSLCEGDCNDADPALFPGNVEVCDGFDNDCDPATAFGGPIVPLVHDTGIGTADAQANMGTGGFTGNVYTTSSAEVLQQLEVYIGDPANTNVLGVVMVRTSPSDPFTLVISTPLDPAASRDWAATMPLSINLLAGRQYFFGVWWQNTALYTTGASTDDPDWGSFEGRYQSAANVGFGFPHPTVNPLDPAQALGVRITTAVESPEDDSDSDGVPVCAFDCNDHTAVITDQCACDDGVESGELDGADPTFNRPIDPSACNLSSIATAVSYDAYDYLLLGPGPHDLTADLCDAAAFNSIVLLYQGPLGLPDPFDPAHGCENLVAMNDDSAACTSSTSLLAATGLGEGWVTVVVTSFFDGELGLYDLGLSSGSCVN
jgi:hypothetical protein